MYQFISILTIIVSILLVLIVLVQNSKGGGLASNFSSSNQMMGVRKTTDFLEKATWSLAGALMVLAFVAVMFLPKNEQKGAMIDEKLDSMMPTQTEQPAAFPAPAQGEGNNTETTEDKE